MAPKPMRENLYAPLLDALTKNGGYVYRGRDNQTGPQLGRGTLLMLERRGWVRLVRAEITNPRTQQKRHEVAGGWLLPRGRAALRDETTRRGADMPARLALPEHLTASTRPATPTRPPVTLRPAPAAPCRPAPARTRTTTAPGRTGTALMERPARTSVTAMVDAFALLGTGHGADDDIPF